MNSAIMPQYCCVPQCTNASEGHTFPRNKLRQRWNVAIRVDPVTKKLWEPGPCDRVCGDHFTDDDYSESSYLGLFI